MAGLRLGDTAPDFTQHSSAGDIHFRQWLGDSWGVLFSHPADSPRCAPQNSASWPSPKANSPTATRAFDLMGSWRWGRQTSQGGPRRRNGVQCHQRSAILEFELMLAVRDENGDVSNIPLWQIHQAASKDIATLGLSLPEGKELLAMVQHEIVTRQFEATTRHRQQCAQCGLTPSIKDYHGARFRTLFGDVELRVPRYTKCGCAGTGVAGSRQARQRWISAELECVQSELAATLSYERSSQILRLLLPIGSGHSASTVRDRTLRVGQRLEAEQTATPVTPASGQSSVTTIGLDGGYVRHCDAELGHNFEIIGGRVLAEDGSQRCVAFVRTVDEHSRTRVQHAVAALGGAHEELRVFTDGDGALRDLQLSVLPEATHVLDWYHLTRRLTVLASVINGKEAASRLPARDRDRLSEWMDSVKWRLWHGRAAGAITRLQAMLGVMARHSVPGEAVVKRITKLTTELLRYLENNADSIPDYGQRYRAGERISTSFVESAVNQIIDKRMSKSQQMRWSPKSAHLLLQVRTSVLDGRLRQDFARWYPGFAANDSDVRLTA
jgi:hypothetical protein